MNTNEVIIIQRSDWEELECQIIPVIRILQNNTWIYGFAFDPNLTEDWDIPDWEQSAMIDEIRGPRGRYLITALPIPFWVIRDNVSACMRIAIDIFNDSLQYGETRRIIDNDD